MKSTFSRPLAFKPSFHEGQYRLLLDDPSGMVAASLKHEAICDVDEFEPLLGIEVLFFDSLGDETLFERLINTPGTSGAVLFSFNGETGVAYFRLAVGRARTQLVVSCAILLDTNRAFIGLDIPDWVPDYRFTTN
jgi:hypothetical protein